MPIPVTAAPPAATVAVNDLESRGLVSREIDPENRRCKLVSLTDAGRKVVAILDEIEDPAPPALAELGSQDLAALHRILAKLGR